MTKETAGDTFNIKKFLLLLAGMFSIIGLISGLMLTAGFKMIPNEDFELLQEAKIKGVKKEYLKNAWIDSSAIFRIEDNRVKFIFCSQFKKNGCSELPDNCEVKSWHENWIYYSCSEVSE